MEKALGQIVRQHAPHPTTPAIDRFVALTDRILVGDDYRVVWRGGDTFRVDDADQELEISFTAVCDPLRRSLAVRSARRY
jgi:hypothetical protein